jgi:hypothetical protein
MKTITIPQRRGVTVVCTAPFLAIFARWSDDSGLGKEYAEHVTAICRNAIWEVVPRLSTICPELQGRFYGAEGGDHRLALLFRVGHGHVRHASAALKAAFWSERAGMVVERRSRGKGVEHSWAHERGNERRKEVRSIAR